jgi:hypothetical protein
MAAKRATVIFGGMTVLFGDAESGPHPAFRLGGFSYEMSNESLLALQAFLVANPQYTPALNGGDMSGLIASLQSMGVDLALSDGADPAKIKTRAEAALKHSKK